MPIDIQLAMKAMQGMEFRKFMKTEIKITNEDDIRKLGGCGSCWNNAGFTTKTVEKINDKLKEMDTAGKLDIKIQVHSKWFQDKKSLIKFIEELDGDDVLEYFAGFKK